MKIERVVLDTSVVIKWFHAQDEQHVENALILQDAYLSGALEVSIPDLLIYEFANALRYKRTVSQETVSRYVRSVWASGVNVCPADAELSEQIVRISYGFGISIYDSAYVAVAAKLGATLITADAAMYRNVKDNYPVVSLADLDGTPI